MNILVTGAAGFIGYHLIKNLLNINNNNKIFGIDNINNYYDVDLKKNRLKNLQSFNNFNFKKIDICSQNTLNHFVKTNKIKVIIHLAAQAGVRYSIRNPQTYFNNNIFGFNNILEVSRNNKIKHLLFASTSSVYGDTKKFPLSEDHLTNSPLTYYAASKKSNEVSSFSYSNIYKLPITCMRFFTVYGPFGRPDMALFKFTKNIIENKKIDVFNFGNHSRDFTYVDDICLAIIGLIRKPNKTNIPYNVFNIGSGKPITLNRFIKIIEKNLNLKAKINLLPLQTGDVIKTYANINKISNYTNYKPKFNVDKGVENFINWYREYYNV